MTDANDGNGAVGATGASSRRHNPAVDDTAAFQRFYLDEPAAPPAPPPAPSLVHRLFVGWWRDRRAEPGAGEPRRP